MTPSQGVKTGVGWLPPATTFQRRINMDYEEFTKLSEEEQKTIIQGYNEGQKTISDHEAEILSLKKELEEKDLVLQDTKKDLAATKEMNYTLARKVNTEKEHKTFEEILHESMNERS